MWLCCLNPVRVQGITLAEAKGARYCYCEPTTFGSPSDNPDAVDDAREALAGKIAAELDALDAYADEFAAEQDALETLFGDFHTFKDYEYDLE